MGLCSLGGKVSDVIENAQGEEANYGNFKGVALVERGVYGWRL